MHFVFEHIFKGNNNLKTVIYTDTLFTIVSLVFGLTRAQSKHGYCLGPGCLIQGRLLSLLYQQQLMYYVPYTCKSIIMLKESSGQKLNFSTHIAVHCSIVQGLFRHPTQGQRMSYGGMSDMGGAFVEVDCLLRWVDKGAPDICIREIEPHVSNVNDLHVKF